MKKVLSVVLALVLVLGVCVAAQATPYYLESAGVTIEVPDGMTAQDLSSDGTSMLGITVDADPALKYAYAVFYIDELEGKYLEDLSEEESQQLGIGIGSSIENPEVGFAELEGYPVLVVASGDATQLHYISLLNGWACDVAVGRTDGELNDDDIVGAATLLNSITFDGAEEE